MIGYSAQGDQFIVSAPEEYDLYYSSSQRNIIIDYIYHCRVLAGCGNNLKIFLADTNFLEQYARHPDQKIEGPVRQLSDTMTSFLMSHEEFQINFCKKNTVTQNLMDTGQLS